MLDFLQHIIDNWKSFEQSAVTVTAIEEKRFVADTFSKEYPKYLGVQRPRTSPQTKKYRKEYFENLGNPALEFLIRHANTFNIVFDSEEFSINFGDDKDSIYHLEKYLKDEYFEGDFVEKFKESIYHKLVNETNGVMYVYPGEVLNEAELPKPIIGFEPAENVLFYSDTMCFFRSSKKTRLAGEDRANGNIFYLFTNFHYVVFRQISGSLDTFGLSDLSKYEVICKAKSFDSLGRLASIDGLEHYCPYMPVFLLGKDINKKDYERGNYCKTSLIKQAIPFLRAAQLDWIDCGTHKAHNSGGFSWAITNLKCDKCFGSGSMRVGDTMEVETCSTCKGSGNSMNVHSGDFGDVVGFSITDSGLLTGEQNEVKKALPSQMFGNYDGNPEIAEHYWKGYSDLMEKAYFACSMDVLTKISATVSEGGKALDREELSKAIVTLSEIECDYLQRILTCVAYQRLYTAVGKDDIEKYIPYVRTPRHFDNFSREELTKIVSEMNTGGFSNSFLILNNLKLAEKEFGSESVDYKKEVLKNKIDPLAGVSADLRPLVLSTLTWEEYVMAMRLNYIIDECEREEEIIQTTCEVRRAEVSCKPKINAFWSLEIEQQIQKIKVKAKALSLLTVDNRVAILQN